MSRAFLVVGMLITILLAGTGMLVIIDLLALLLTCDSIFGTVTSSASNVIDTCRGMWRTIGLD